MHWFFIVKLDNFTYFLFYFEFINEVGVWDPLHECPWEDASDVEKKLWRQDCCEVQGKLFLGVVAITDISLGLAFSNIIFGYVNK